jgi:hypothetical protein
VSEETALSIVILTEDDGKDGRATVEALARRMLHLVVPGFGSHRVHFVPREAREEEAMRGSYWKDKGRNPEGRTPEARERRVRLLRYIARRLSQPDTFVFFHSDGDRTWDLRHTSENTAEFDRLVRVALPQVVDRGRANGPRAKARAQPAAPEPPPMHLDRLLLLCPFRSIEAWLYQNVRAAIDICRREHRSAHVGALQAWETQRDQLDELPAPEKTMCLKKEFNLELAKSGFPAREAYDVKKSFAESVDRLLGCDALTRALERTQG